MSSSEEIDLAQYLGGGRQLLDTAAEVYGRTLTPEEYWWMGVALAATTLAEMDGKHYAVNRLEQLVDRLGYKGARGDWQQRFVEELAELNAEGLVWPLCQRSEAGAMEPSGAELSSRFDAEAAYFLALGHIGVALSLNRENQRQVESLTDAILGLVQGGCGTEWETAILSALKEAVKE